MDISISTSAYVLIASHAFEPIHDTMEQISLSTQLKSSVGCSNGPDTTTVRNAHQISTERYAPHTWGPWTHQYGAVAFAQRHRSKAVRASRKVHFTGTPSLPGDTTSAASRCLSPQSQPQQPPETAAVAQGYQGEGPDRRETIISARACSHKQLSRRLTAAGGRCTKQQFAVRRMRRRAQRKLWEDAGREACAQRHGLRQTPRRQRWDTQTMQPRRQEPQLAGEGIRVASTGV